jgi:hypothetical protein
MHQFTIIQFTVKLTSACLCGLFIFTAQANASGYTPRLGDLMFQDTNCGEFCDNIDAVTSGYGNRYVSHVALVVSTKPPLVVEAISRGVVLTPLKQFLARSVDAQQHPRVMVGRLKAPYRQHIPTAVQIARAQVGKPYNNSFIAAGGKSFYCSELVSYAFNQAYHNPNFMPSQPMDFTNGKSTQILLRWQNYYHELNLAVPQGQPGTNPGALSRLPQITIIYYYGQLRQHAPAQPLSNLVISDG